MLDQRTPDVRSGYAAVPSIRPRSLPVPRRRRSHDGRKRVLLLNGDADTRLIFASVLERSGYHVAAAEDEKKGARLLRRMSPDLIVADHTTRTPEGRPLVPALRSDPRTADVSMLTLTSEPMPKELETMEEDDRLRCLATPVSPGRLVREVRMLIGEAE